MGINGTHLKVLLKKNFLVLTRNKCQGITFLVLPLVTMGIFVMIFALAVGDSGNLGVANNMNYAFYTTTDSADLYPAPTGTNMTQFDSLSTPFNGCFGQQKNVWAFAKNGNKDQEAEITEVIADLNSYVDAVNKFIEAVRPTSTFRFKGVVYNSEKEMENAITNAVDDKICFGVTFNDWSSAKKTFDVSVRYATVILPSTNIDPYNPLQKAPLIIDWQQWTTSGAIQVYSVLAHSALKQMDASKASTPIELVMAPYKSNPFINLPQQLSSQLVLVFPLYFMFTFLLPLFYMTSKLAEEKESRAREGMKMMGLSDSTYFLSWFIFHVFVIVIQSAEVAIMTSFNVFPSSNPFLIFLFCVLYGLCIFSFVLCVVALIPSQGAASTAGTLLWVISFFLFFAIQGQKVSTAVKVLFAILPNIALAESVNNLFYLELQAGGLNFSNAQQMYQNFSFALGLGMLTVFAVVFSLLGFYLDAVVPSPNGVAKPWNFLCVKKKQVQQDEDRQPLVENDGERDARNFEAVPEVLLRQEDTGECLKVRNLVKHFGEKKAVQGVDLTMYNGQIFALLGHNGAGKTTTISMLTGLIPATGGQSSLGDLNILQNQAEFRKQLGVCPQHDILFEYLTPYEHLRLFSAFKGTPASQIDEQVNKILSDIDLLGQKNQIAKTLSGGQKRKLSVAIALVGDSKVVMLDEPTSGMDTTARRKLWDMLKEYKNDRIIILTTHYMDEADILGDRIAIMSDGRVKCNGTSLFLKARFGVGYNLVMAKVGRDPAPQVHDFVLQHIPTATKLSEVSQELTFQLPSDSSNQFKTFFTALDANLEQLGIRSYGVGFTTLEEVFLKIEEKDEDGAQRQSLKELRSMREAKESLAGSLNPKEEDPEANEEYSVADQSETSLVDQFGAMFKKKVLIQIRDPKSLLIQEFFPCILVALGMYLSSIKFFYQGQPRIMAPSLYPNPKLIYNKNPLAGSGSTATFTDRLKVAYPKFEIQTPWDNTATFKDQAYTNNLIAFQDYLFEHDMGGTYGQYFYNEIDSSRYSIGVLVNATAQDAVGAYSAFVLNNVLRDITGDSTVNFKVYDHPLPVSAKFLGIESSSAGFTAAFLFAVSFMMIGNQLVQTIIREKEKQLRHQMIVSGGNIQAYWLSHYAGDLIFQLLPILVAIISYLAVGTDLPYGWLLFLLFLFSNAPFVYAMSFAFKKDSQGGIAVSLMILAIGWIGSIAIGILQVIPSTIKAAKICRYILMIFPIYSLNYGIICITGRNLLSIVDRANGDLSYEAENYGPLNVNTGLPSVIFLAFDLILYWAIVILIEKDAFRFLRGAAKGLPDKVYEGEDEDIGIEERRIMSEGTRGFPVRVKQLKKVYPPTIKYGDPVLAVDRVSFGLEYGECFALLGVSGAGKTTTFKCLTGEEKPSTGLAGILGHDLSTKEGFEKARKLIGYCPQFDSIFPGMTVREHLEFYATIKGIIVSKREEQVKTWLREMDLQEYENVRMDKLSGGNKRKTSVAMAMIGNPPIIFLDEPSTGVDPKARRFMWGIVSKISTLRKKSSVIITTHSMEEAEALSTKMGIMVKGRFKCFGSTSHIKAKYGTGYEIEIKTKINSEEAQKQQLRQACGKKVSGDRVGKEEAAGIVKILLERINKAELQQALTEMYHQEFNPAYQKGEPPKIDEILQWVDAEVAGQEILVELLNTFSDVKVNEHYGNFFKFQVSRDDKSIGQLFGIMEDLKQNVEIGEYQVSQTSLEQIFNNFAKESEGPQLAQDNVLAMRVTHARRRTTQMRKPNGSSAAQANPEEKDIDVIE